MKPLTALTRDLDFLPQGLLVRPRTAKLLDVGFQDRVPTGFTGVKARFRAWEARLGFPRHPFLPREARLPLVLTDEFSNGFFHWVGDVLPKLACLTPALHLYELILPWYASRFPYMIESLAAWPQLRWAIAEPRSRLALEGALIVPALAPTGNFRPSVMRSLGSVWRDRVQPQGPTRHIYVSRAKAPWRKIHNEDAVWSALSALHYERVFLEDLSFADQVKLAAEAAVLVSNHGAGLTVASFMQPGARVLEIRLKGDAHNNCYYALADAVGLEYRYLVAPPATDNADAHTADLVVDVPALLAALEARS